MNGQHQAVLIIQDNGIRVSCFYCGCYFEIENHDLRHPSVYPDGRGDRICRLTGKLFGYGAYFQIYDREIVSPSAWIEIAPKSKIKQRHVLVRFLIYWIDVLGVRKVWKSKSHI